MKDTKGKGKAIKIVEDDEGSPFEAPLDSDDEPIVAIYAKRNGKGADVVEFDESSPLQASQHSDGVATTKGRVGAVEEVDEDDRSSSHVPRDNDSGVIVANQTKGLGLAVEIAGDDEESQYKVLGDGADVPIVIDDTEDNAKGLDVVEDDEGSPFPFRPMKRLRIIESDEEEEVEEVEEVEALLQVVVDHARGKGMVVKQSPSRFLGESDDEPIVISHMKGKEKALEVVDDDEWSPFPSRPTKRARIVESDDEGETEEPSQTSLYINPLTLPMLDTQITTSEEGSSQLTNHWPDLLRSTSPLTPIEGDNQEIGHDPPTELRVPSVEWDCGVETALPWFEEVKGSGVNLLQKVGFFIPSSFFYVTFK